MGVFRASFLVLFLIGVTNTNGQGQSADLEADPSSIPPTSPGPEELSSYASTYSNYNPVSPAGQELDLDSETEGPTSKEFAKRGGHSLDLADHDQGLGLTNGQPLDNVNVPSQSQIDPFLNEMQRGLGGSGGEFPLDLEPSASSPPQTTPPFQGQEEEDFLARKQAMLDRIRRRKKLRRLRQQQFQQYQQARTKQPETQQPQPQSQSQVSQLAPTRSIQNQAPSVTPGQPLTQGQGQSSFYDPFSFSSEFGKVRVPFQVPLRRAQPQPQIQQQQAQSQSTRLRPFPVYSRNMAQPQTQQHTAPTNRVNHIAPPPTTPNFRTLQVPLTRYYQQQQHLQQLPANSLSFNYNYNQNQANRANFYNPLPHPQPTTPTLLAQESRAFSQTLLPHPQYTPIRRRFPQQQYQQYQQNTQRGFGFSHRNLPSPNTAATPPAVATPTQPLPLPSATPTDPLLPSSSAYRVIKGQDYYYAPSEEPSYYHEDDDGYYEEEPPVRPRKKSKGKGQKSKKVEKKKEDEESSIKKIYTKTKNAIVSTTKAVFGAPKYIYTRYKAAYENLKDGGKGSKKRASKGHTKKEEGAEEELDAEHAAGWGWEEERPIRAKYYTTSGGGAGSSGGWGWGDGYEEVVDEGDFYDRRGKLRRVRGRQRPLATNPQRMLRVDQGQGQGQGWSRGQFQGQGQNQGWSGSGSGGSTPRSRPAEPIEPFGADITRTGRYPPHPSYHQGREERLISMPSHTHWSGGGGGGARNYG